MQQQQWIETTTNNAGPTKGDIYNGCTVVKIRVENPRGPMQSKYEVASRRGTDKHCVGGQSARMQDSERISSSIFPGHSNVDVKQYGLTDPFDLGDNTFEVKRLCEHDLEDLLHVDRCGCRAKDERSVHRLGEAFGLFRNFLLFIARERRKGIKLGADKKRYRGLHIEVFKVSFNARGV